MPGLTTGEIGLWGTVDGLSTLNGLSTPPGLLADVASASQWTVLDAAGASYLISTTVLSSSDVSYAAVYGVLSSAGVLYNPI